MHMISFCFDLAFRNTLQDYLMVLLRSNEDETLQRCWTPKLKPSAQSFSCLDINSLSTPNLFSRQCRARGGNFTKHIAEMHFLILASYSRSTTISIPDPESSGSRRAVSTTNEKAMMSLPRGCGHHWNQ